MHTLLSPAFNVEGVVTTHAPNLFSLGNDIATTDKSGAPLALSQITAAQAREAMAQLPKKFSRPVIAGSSVPLDSRTTPLPNPGVQFILDTAKKYNSHDRLTVLALGACTDIASALILDPTLKNRIDIVAMGFDSWPKGGDGFNVKNDVTAWQILLDSGVPISIASGAVAIRDLAMDREKSAKLFRSHGSAGKYLDGLINRWMSRNQVLDKKTTGRDAWPIWDEGTVAYLLGYAQATAYPRPVLQDDTTFAHPDSKEKIEWITSVDAAKLWQDLDDNLDKAAGR
jgi:inosine-uridine nucleoside N-ribohydrolase